MLFEGLQDFDLSFDFAFFDWLKHFNDHIFIVGYCDSHIDLRVFSFTNFSDDLVAVDVAE